MKYDDKTGKKTPENRSDAIRISLEKLQNLGEKCGGLFDRNIERNALLIDISISLGLITDILGSMYNNMFNEQVVEEKNNKVN